MISKIKCRPRTRTHTYTKYQTQNTQALGSQSLWAPHIRVQPTTYTTPHYFTEEELEYLEGTPLQYMYAALREGLEANYEQLLKSVISPPPTPPPFPHTPPSRCTQTHKNLHALILAQPHKT